MEIILSKRKIEKTNSFKGVYTTGPIAGTQIVINEFTTFTEYAPLSGSPQWLAGTRAFKTEDGDHLNPSPDGHFANASNGWRVGKA